MNYPVSIHRRASQLKCVIRCQSNPRAARSFDFAQRLTGCILLPLMFGVFSDNAVAATVAVHSNVIDIDGTISPGDDKRVADAMKQMEEYLASTHEVLAVEVKSPGGDVDTAMAIGRLVRGKSALVSSWGCASACVLIYAAGTARLSTQFHKYSNVYYC
jgi:hypothetical protein